MGNQRTGRNTPIQYDQCRNQCYRCGFPWSDRHFCPAFRQECFRCGVFGHFGRMCFSRSVDILYRRTKPKKQRARDQRRMEEFLQRKSVMMFLPFADIENEHLGACLYTKAPKEVSKVNMVQVQTPVSSAKAQTQTSASTSDSSSQTEPDSTTISTLQQLWKSVNFLRDETTVLHVSCDQIVKEGQQDFSLFKEQTQKLADIAIRQKAENDQLKQQLEQSLGQINNVLMLFGIHTRLLNKRWKVIIQVMFKVSPFGRWSLFYIVGAEVICYQPICPCYYSHVICLLAFPAFVQGIVKAFWFNPLCIVRLQTPGYKCETWC